MKLFRCVSSVFSLALGVLLLLFSMSMLAQDSAGSGMITLAQAQPSAQPTPAAESSDLSKLQAELKNAQDKLKDWPNLGRYHDADAQVQPPAAGEKRVVFMGDSITDGWGRKYGKFFPDKPYVNRGISGQTTPQMLIRFRPDVIALKPKVVVILAGTNDISGNTGPMTLDQIEGNLTSMFDLAHANGIRVVFASVLPISDYEKNKDGQPIVRTKQRPPEQITSLNDWMKKYAAAHGGIYLDYFSAMADDKGFLKEELSEDGLHPNQKGYDIMAPLAEQAIAAALKSRR